MKLIEADVPTAGNEPRPRASPLAVPPLPWAGTCATSLPRAVREPGARFLDVLRARRSTPGEGPLLPIDLASVLWHATLLRERRPASSCYSAWESRAAPSAGGLHAVATLCLPLDENLPAGVHDAAHHTIATMPGHTEAALAANAASVCQIIGVHQGVTLQFVADMARLNASYEHCETLAWRDAGALLAVVLLVAEALGLAGTPLGRNGDAIAAAAGLAGPRWVAVGAVHLTSRLPKASNSPPASGSTACA